MKVIVDSSPLIFLSKLNHLDLLNDLFEEVFVTNSVLEEVFEGLSQGHQDALLVKKNLEQNRIKLLKVTKKLVLDHLGTGEKSVIEAAVEHNITSVIFDDLSAIKTAKYFGLEIVSTPFLLLKSLTLGKLKKVDFIDSVNKLICDFDYRISPIIYKRILDEAHNYK